MADPTRQERKQRFKVRHGTGATFACADIPADLCVMMIERGLASDILKMKPHERGDALIDFVRELLERRSPVNVSAGVSC